MQKSTPLHWNDIRYLVALADCGSLSATARMLGVDHTTVGRRVEAAEAALGVRLFTRSAAGYALTLDGARLLPAMQDVAASVHSLQRAAQANETAIEGTIRVTSPETFGMSWLATKLAVFAARHPRVTIRIDPTGVMADLGRGEAEVALRNVRSAHQRLIVRQVALVGFGLYATPRTLAAHPVAAPADLAHHRLLSPPRLPASIEGRWLERLAPGQTPALVSELSMTLLAAATAHLGVAVLPRYLGDAEPALQHIALPDEPTEAMWLTVHEDARSIPRVRALLDFLKQAFSDDADTLQGRAAPPTPKGAESDAS